MNLLIKMDSGQPVDHPIMEENARQAWPDVDFDNLPSWLSRFRRVAQPSLEEMPVGIFQRAKCTYVIASDSVVEDSWSVEDMTAEEQHRLSGRAGQSQSGCTRTPQHTDRSTCTLLLTKYLIHSV